jgi:hypothetical protein
MGVLAIRIIVTNEFFAKWVAHMVMTTTYENFKSGVVVTCGSDFAHPLMKVWSAMHKVEDAQARS